MGIYDRDYYRPERPQGVQLRPPQTMVMTLIVINVALWVADWIFFRGRLMEAMAASVQSLSPLYWWQLVTAGFAHDPGRNGDIMHILINMFVLWSFGREVEPRLRKWEFLRFYLVAIVLGNLAFALRQYLMVGPDAQSICLGASGAVTAVVMLFIFYYPNATLYLMMVFPVKAWVAGILMIALNVFGTGGVYGPDGAHVAYDVHLVGAAFAFWYFQFHWNLGALIPASFSSGAASVARSLRGRPKLRVHLPEDRESEQRYRDLDDEADRILAKINEHGEESLTDSERRTLEDYSRRMRQKHR